MLHGPNQRTGRFVARLTCLRSRFLLKALRHLLSLIGKGTPPLDLGRIVHPPRMPDEISTFLQQRSGIGRSRMQRMRRSRNALAQRRAIHGLRQISSWYLRRRRPDRTGLVLPGEHVIADLANHLIQAAERFGIRVSVGTSASEPVPPDLPLLYGTAS